MRFYTFLLDGKEVPCVSFDGGKQVYALEAIGVHVKDINELILSFEEMKKILVFCEEKGTDAAPIDLSRAKLLSPIVRPRQDVICLGINYTAHAEEAGMYSREAFGGERPYTIYFSKRVSRATGSGEPIPFYEGLVDSLDYECELGVVLGKDVKGISRDEADNAIFGYTIINDVSARNLQTRHKQWYLGKSLDGFLPMGPCIVTPDEIGDAADLNIRCFVNEELRQDSNTSMMLQTVEGAITELAQGMTLQAGTIIATGTPAGVGMGMNPPCFLKAGDTVACEIEKIGQLVNTVE